MTITYSPQQEALFNWVREGRGNLFLRARAGTGKSTTLVGAVRHMQGSVAMAAYNKAAGDELRAKLNEAGIDLTHVRAGTFHSFGWNALRRVYPHAKVDEHGKQDALLEDVRLPRQPDAHMPKELQTFVFRLVSLAKQSALGLYGSRDDQSRWWAIVDHHDLASDLDDPALAQEGIRWAYQTLKYSNALLPRFVNFDDMIYVPAVRPVRVWQNDWVLVDEAQDTNPARRALARKMLRPGGRAIFVGDDKQCQPPGTGVWVTGRGYVPIEAVSVGDQVMTYCNGYFPGKKAQGRMVEAVASRHYEGDLIELTAGKNMHRVTPNHRCLVRLGSGTHVGKYSFVTQASNLIDGWMSVCTFTGSPHEPVWETAAVRRVPYCGPVHSLQVEPCENKRRLYVADGIVTHNSIYGFTGADDDAVGLILQDFSCAELPLTVTYRCPKSVVSEARTLVPDYEAHDSAPQGTVRRIEEHILLQEEGLRADDAILCRKTAPLVSWAFRLISAGVPCHVEGRDIGAGLLKLVNRWKVRTMDALRERLAKYREREVEKLMAKGQEAQAESLSDRVDTLVVLMDGCADLNDLRRKIEDMFQDNAKTLTLATVHRSKGREWPRVYLLGRYQFMPSPFARQEWQARQEENLIYVAITRAQAELIYVDTTL